MTSSATATRTYVGPAPTRSSPWLKAVPALRWPQNVPSRAESVTLLFDTQTLPDVVRSRTAFLMKVLVAKQLSVAPADVDAERWGLALATVFRLQAALALAPLAEEHDEPALQELLHEAAEVRDWLLELTWEAVFEPTERVLALRRLLQGSWDLVLSSAPEQKELAPERPEVHSGLTGLHSMPRKPVAKKPAPTASQWAGAPSKISGRRVALIATLAASLGLFWVAGPARTEVATGGAPQGWILAGDLALGPATVMSATTLPGHRAEVLAWLEELRKQGVDVQPHGNDEWILINSNTEAGR